MSRLLLVLALFVAPLALAQDPAEPSRIALDYVSRDPGGTKTPCAGALFVPAGKGPHPALIVIHDWMGPSAWYEDVARAYAARGMVTLAADAYGTAVRPKDRKGARAASGTLKKDPALFRARMRAALKALLARPEVDRSKVAAIGYCFRSKVAAIGYCFGGTAVLELARDGAAIAGVISVHGGLSASQKAVKGTLRARVLVLHGAADPFVPPAAVAGFTAEMNAAGADWQLIQYAGAVHAFTKPSAGKDPSKGAAYHATAARRARGHALLFLEELFSRRLR